MKILIDMNLSPDWIVVFQKNGFDAIHWSTIGAPRATDSEIMKWAREEGCVIFTHDLDFGALLAVTKAGSPSVIQVRTQDVTVMHLEEIVIKELHNNAKHLEEGALIVIDEYKSRVRILPLK